MRTIVSIQFSLQIWENNVYIGHQAAITNNTGQNNTIIGSQADMSGSHFSSIALGAFAETTASLQARIGNSSFTSIGGYTGWTNVSDSRFKTNVKENVPGLNFIMRLRPVSYHLNIDAIDSFYHKDRKYSKEELANKALKEQQQLQTGFIAQEVEAISNELGYEFSGIDAPKNDKDHYGLRYAEFMVPLVKAMQEQQEEIDELRALVLELKEEIKNK